MDGTRVPIPAVPAGYDKEFGDLILHVEWRYAPREPDYKKYNSSIFVRTSKYGEIWYQAQAGLALPFASFSTPGLSKTRDCVPASMAFPLPALDRRLEFVFRSSIPRPSMSLSTLHPAPRGQDSKSRWFATPFLWGSFIPDCTPVYPDACACLRMAVQ